MSSRNATRLAVTLALVTLAMGLAEVKFHLFGDLFGSRSLSHRELATQFLGQYLATRYPGKRAVVISNPFSDLPGQPREVRQFEKAGLHGLQRGLGTKMTIERVVFPELKPGLLQDPHSAFIDPRTTTPLSYMVSDSSLDQIAHQFPEATIVVSLIGLPINVRQTETWKSSSRRVFALLLPDLRMLGDQSEICQAFQSGKLAAVILNKPGAPPSDRPLGKDPTLEFEQRFLLLTPENIDRYLRIYPRLF